MPTLRPPAVAGLFYPDDPATLQREVDRLLAAAPHPSAPTAIKALVVPHAGYVYSGATAARAFAELTPQADTIERVILLGPAHRVGFLGLALADTQSFVTPLGPVPLDLEASALIASLPQVHTLATAHQLEHSLEVQLPFLQRVLGAFKLLPLVVGEAQPQEVAEVLDRLWGGPETLIVVSSDLSHYLPYAQAQRRDRHTCQAVEALDETAIGEQDACGRHPLRGLLRCAKAHHLTATTLALCNSGDGIGDRQRVVGYGAWRFCEAEA